MMIGIQKRLKSAGLTAGLVILTGSSVPMVGNSAEGAGAGALPINARPGECYAKVVIPAEYKTSEERVLVREASHKIEVIPAKYELTEVRVPTKDASSKLITVPASYKSVTEKVEIEPAHTLWRLGPDAKSKTAGSRTLAAAFAMGLSKDAKPGQCFSEYFQDAQYKTETVKILKKEGTQEVSIEPPKFEWKEEKVLVKEASSKIIEVPAQYEVKEEKVLEAPAYTTWKAGRGPNERIDNATGEIMCLVEVPAKYRTVTKRVLKSPATIKKIEIPAEYKMVRVQKLVEPAKENRMDSTAEYQTVEKQVKLADAKISWHMPGQKDAGKATGNQLCLTEVPAKYKTITKQVVDKPASIKTVEVPATYKMMSMNKLVAPAQDKRIEIPAKYEIINKRTKISDERQEWRPVLCQTNTTKELVTEIQRGLSKAGFNPGAIDGILGQQTIRAMDAYQRKNNLPRGGLTMQAIEKLGIKVGG
jgi:hypothetical protein